MTFRLTTIFYLFAVVATSLAVFGVWGLLVAGLVLALWANRFHFPRPWLNSIEIGVFVLILGVVVALLIPAVQNGGPSLSSHSRNNLRQLTLAIINYESANGQFPPPYVTDDNGKPLYSWRVLILPYLEEERLFKQFKLDEPWDSPANRKLIPSDISLWQSPRLELDKNAPGETHYLAIVENETTWNPDAKTSFRDVTDGSSDTILLLEVGGRGIRWSEPRDLTMDEAIDLLMGKSDEQQFSIDEGYFVSHKYAFDGLPMRCVAFADGRVQYMGPLKNLEDAKSLLTRNGSETFENLDELDRPYKRTPVGKIIHWGRIWGVFVWLVVVLLPSNRTARRKIWPMPIDAKDESDGAINTKGEH